MRPYAFELISPAILAANSPPKISNSPLERFQVSRLLLFEVQIKQRTVSTRTIMLMRVSKGVKVFIFGASVLIGFAASSPEALAQG